MSDPPLRLAPGRRAFLLPDGRAVLLVAGRQAPLMLAGPGLSDLLDRAAGAGLDDHGIAMAARSGTAGTLRLLLDQKHVVRLGDPPQPQPLPAGVLDARGGALSHHMPGEDGFVVLLVADHTQPGLRGWADRAWRSGRTLIPIALRPDGMVAGPVARPGSPCLDCALRRQAGLRPIEAALWSGTGGARPLPLPSSELVVDPAPLAAAVHALLDRAGPLALRHSGAGMAAVWHPLHPGPGCQDCPSHVPRGPVVPRSPRALLDALSPWIGPEAGLAMLLPSADSDAPVRVELAREALRQTTDRLDWAIAQGVAACTGKSVDRYEARLGAVAEAIERGALLTALPEADRGLALAGPGGLPGDGYVVGRCLHDGSAWRVARASVQLAPLAGSEADSWFEPCGTAFGHNEADAIERALLERLERDAVLRWWRLRALLPPLVPEPSCAPAVAALLQQVAGQLGPLRAAPWVLDATTEIGLPVAVAVSVLGNGGLPILGFGAGWSAGDAAVAALRELVAQGRRLDAAMARPVPGCAVREWAMAGAAEHRFLFPIVGATAAPRAGTDRATVLQALLAHGMRALTVVHFTVWPGGPCVARVVIPGLNGLAQFGLGAPGHGIPSAAPGWEAGSYAAAVPNPWVFPG